LVFLLIIECNGFIFFMRSLVFSYIVVVCELIVKNVLILNFC